MPVAITAASIVSCVGSTLPEARKALQDAASGLKRDHQWLDKIPAPAGVIPESWIEDALNAAPRNKTLTRLEVITNRLVTEVVTATSLTERYKTRDIGLSISTTSAGVEHWLGKLTKFGADWQMTNPKEWFGVKDHGGTLADSILSHFPFRGPDVTFSTACSGGALAIARGAEMIRRGDVKACIVGGIDILTSLTMHGFNALQVMDHDLCQPFHPARNGMNLSEGGAFFVLEAKPKDQPLGAVAGYGMATDFFHMTQPTPTGEPMALCMRRALDNAGWTPDMVSYVNAHGTGTKANDAAEELAIKHVFGAEAFFNSTKAMHGHALAGAGALEAALTIDALNSQTFFADPRLPDHVAAPLKARYAISNSFGFGGHNVSLALSVWTEDHHG